jgi:microcystin degradation protein MlrC
MRIAVGGIGHETNTFSTLKTTLDDFHVRRGEEVVQGTFWDAVRAQGVEPVPTLQAGASPHGPVERDTYLSLKRELLERLEQALPVDGVYLSLHGAMEVDGIGDGESDLLGAVRERVGPAVPISVSLDLHGNIAPAVVEAANVLTALRTAPHRDGEPTRRRALDHLVRTVREGLRPVSVILPIPLLLPGEYAITEVEPARSLYAMLPEIEAASGIMDASLMIGCAWTDSPYTSAAAIVVAERDRGLAQAQAARLARAVWEQRAAFGPDVEVAPIEEAVSRALAARESTVFLSDSGDNVTAGGAGDLTLVLAQLLTANAPDAVVAGIADAEAVARCAAAGVSGRVSVAVGGKLDQVNGRALEVTGVVRHLYPTEAPTLAVLQVEGVQLVLAADRRAFASFAAFREAGIEPLEHKVVVVKLGYLFPELRDNAPRAIMVQSPGFTDLRMEALPYRRVRRPIYPLDRDMEWDVPAG